MCVTGRSLQDDLKEQICSVLIIQGLHLSHNVWFKVRSVRK